MRERITSIRCSSNYRRNDYTYNNNRDEATTRERRPRIEHNHEPKYYIRIGTTGKLYVSKHEVAGYEKDGFKVHKEE